MLMQIENPTENEYIERFNKKIFEYNQLRKRSLPNDLVYLQRLQEINHMHMQINRLLIDAPRKEKAKYEGIRYFKGIGDELSIFSLPTSNGLLADNKLTIVLANPKGLPSIEEWKKATSFNQHSKQSDSILEDFEKIHEFNKLKAAHPSNASKLKYFYALNSFKNDILDKICSELTDEITIQNFRSLLQRVNHEILETQKAIPNLRNRHEFAESVMEISLYKELSKLSVDKIAEIVNILRSRTKIAPGSPTKKEIEKLLPSLVNFDMENLGGSNNINWKITDRNTRMSLVIQLGPPTQNQLLIHQLEHSSVNDYLSTPFFSSQLSETAIHNLVLTDLCSRGDLRSLRENTSATDSEDLILSSAISRLNQLTTISQGFLSENVAHHDIKLKNFLIDSAGNIVITDKKSFAKIDPNGNISMRSLETTSEFAPPEFRARDTKESANAEAFMTYQLGLAIYDYVVLPEVSDDLTITPWYSKSPLDFTNPIFTSERGQKIKKLIEKMTDPDPGKRAKLEDIRSELKPFLADSEKKQQLIEAKELWKKANSMLEEANIYGYLTTINELSLPAKEARNERGW